MYIYPAIYDGKVKSISDFHPALHLEHLYHYLITNKRIINLKGANTKLLYILSDDVLKLIKDGNPAWELMVPRRVSQIIKNKKMFDLFVPLMLDQDEEEAIY